MHFSRDKSYGIRGGKEKGNPSEINYLASLPWRKRMRCSLSSIFSYRRTMDAKGKNQMRCVSSISSVKVLPIIATAPNLGSLSHSGGNPSRSLSNISCEA